MSDNIAMKCTNLGKKFCTFDSVIKRLLDALGVYKNFQSKEFWSLQSIDLEIRQGTSLGLIGQNGSGKSTLLYLLMGILKPTTGSIHYNGRIAGLLELGAGFNPEFTGRENILLNYSAQDFNIKDMKEKLDQIEQFADIGAFFDQPVKTYSSGMFVRLAFASAIHTDPDILLVDEALAVGDARFQQKCYRKFQEFRAKNKTVVLVSHDLETIVRHCDEVIWLDKGKVMSKGNPRETVDKYLAKVLFNDEQQSCAEKIAAQEHVGVILEAKTGVGEIIDIFLRELVETDNCMVRNTYNKFEVRMGDRRVEIVDYLLVVGERPNPREFLSGDRLELYLKVKFNQDIKLPMYGLALQTVDGIMVYGVNSLYTMNRFEKANAGEQRVVKFSFNINLHEGDFFLDCGCGEILGSEQIAYDRRSSMIHIHVAPKNRFDGIVDMQTEEEECSMNILSMNKSSFP